MGCGCKSGGNKKTSYDVNDSEESPRNLKFLEHVVKIARIILITVLLTIAIPIIWFVIVYIVIKSFYGEPFDIGRTLQAIKGNKSEDIAEEKINIDDYELVGVDKVD